jgi:hypothetical protein
MTDFIMNQKKKAKQVFLVHGEYATQQSWKAFLGSNGFNHVSIPALGEMVRLE